jgi:hypothetical protein
LLDERTSSSPSRVSSTSGAPDDLQCAKDTLSAPQESLPPSTSPNAQANAVGNLGPSGFAPSWTPPASCARFR